MTPHALRITAERWLAERRPAIDVSVLQHRGSVPREAGTHMLVSGNDVAGTIGGGHLEQVAIAQARRWLMEPGLREAALREPGLYGAPTSAAPVDQHYALGPSLGQCCGGSLTLRHQWLDAAALAAWPAPAPRFTLQMHGAGHVGRAIAALLAGIDCRVSWIDEREDEFPPLPTTPEALAATAHIQRIVSDGPEAEVASAPPASHYLVLTHSHELDLRITEAILKRGDFAWLGLIGSATKRARFMHRFEQRGIAPEALARLTCPIGLPGITGKEPEVIAVAVVGQLLATIQSPSPPPQAGRLPLGG